MTRTASVTVSVEVPEITTDFQNKPVLLGDISATFLEIGSRCISFANPNWYLLNGCSAGGSPGVFIDGALKPVPKVISTRGESKVKFVQIVNTYMTRTNASTGACEVMTKRTSKGDTNTGWMLDDTDPYGVGTARPAFGNIDATNQNRGSTISMDDSPSAGPLTPGYNWTIEDKFEAYMVYYTGTEEQPRNEKAIGKLEWSWGGSTTYNAADNSHREVPGSLFPANHTNVVGTKLTPTNNGTGIRAYERTPVQTFVNNASNWKSCGGGTTTPPGGGTRNGGTFLSQSVPATMEAGGVYPVSVTVRNSGDTTWTSDVYKLGAQNPHDNSNWGTNRIYLPAGVTVPPGSDYTFNFNVTAPQAGGLYNFQWRMVKEGVEWFGDWSSNVTVNVTSSGSYCDWSMENSCYANGGDWDYSTCQCTYYPNPCGGGGPYGQAMPCYTY